MKNRSIDAVVHFCRDAHEKMFFSLLNERLKKNSNNNKDQSRYLTVYDSLENSSSRDIFLVTNQSSGWADNFATIGKEQNRSEQFFKEILIALSCVS